MPHRLLRCCLPSCIAVIGNNHCFCILGNFSCLVGCNGSSQRRHNIFKPCLMNGDDIHIPFRQNQRCGYRIFGKLQGKQVFPLVKYRRLCSIQIFWLAVIQHPSAESNHISTQINNGKYDTVSECINERSSSGATRNICQQQFLFRKSLL